MMKFSSSTLSEQLTDGLGRLADSWVRMGSSMAKKQGVVDSWGRLAELFLAQSQEQVRGETAARFADLCLRKCFGDLRLDFVSENILVLAVGFWNLCLTVVGLWSG